MLSNSLNLISFHHASTVREAAHRPIALPGPDGKLKTVPCVMDAVDKLEAAKSEIGDNFEASLLSTGPARAFRFQIANNKQPEEIDSPAEPSSEIGAPSKEQMADQIVSSFKKDAFNVLHVRAHGHAHEDVMGMPTAEFVGALQLAAKRLGQPIPAVILESCLMSSLDVLNSMSGAVQTVIASQEVIEANALPHAEVFKAASKGDMNPQKVAGRMVQAAAAHGKADTLTAFDVEALGEVTRKVGQLKSLLDEDKIDNQLRKEIRQSAHFPRRGVETSYRRKLDLRDLGEVLDAVSQGDNEKTAQTAAAAKQALAKATLGQSRGKGYESLSGLSVQTTDLTEQAGWRFTDLFNW